MENTNVLERIEKGTYIAPSDKNLKDKDRQEAFRLLREKGRNEYEKYQSSKRSYNVMLKSRLETLTEEKLRQHTRKLCGKRIGIEKAKYNYNSELIRSERFFLHKIFD